jgi:hypothetical protein
VSPVHWHTIAVWLWNNTAGNLLASAVTTAAGLAWHHHRIKKHITAEVLRTRIRVVHNGRDGGGAR